jgi:hypothetical protein
MQKFNLKIIWVKYTNAEKPLYEGLCPAFAVWCCIVMQKDFTFHEVICLGHRSKTADDAKSAKMRKWNAYSKKVPKAKTPYLPVKNV